MLQWLPFLPGIQLGTDLATFVRDGVSNEPFLARTKVEEVLDVILIYPFHAAFYLVQVNISAGLVTVPILGLATP